MSLQKTSFWMTPAAKAGAPPDPGAPAAPAAPPAPGAPAYPDAPAAPGAPAAQQRHRFQARTDTRRATDARRAAGRRSRSSRRDCCAAGRVPGHATRRRAPEAAALAAPDGGRAAGARVAVGSRRAGTTGRARAAGPAAGVSGSPARDQVGGRHEAAAQSQQRGSHICVVPRRSRIGSAGRPNRPSYIMNETPKANVG